MTSERKPISANGMMLFFLVLINVILIETGYTKDEKWYWLLLISLPLLVWSILNVLQKKHTALRGFSDKEHFLKSDRQEISDQFFEAGLDRKLFYTRPGTNIKKLRRDHF
ncbi:MAG: hypothetical protein ABI687_01965 [Flavitalea sp.]